jgi:hypothetical protein
MDIEIVQMPFGCHRRKRVVDLPRDYILWLQANVPHIAQREPFKTALEVGLKRREEEFVKWATEKALGMARGEKLRPQTINKFLRVVEPVTEVLQ